MRCITYDREIEQLARQMLRETVERSRWYPRYGRENCDRLIERDVDLMWRVMAKAARECLEQREWGRGTG